MGVGPIPRSAMRLYAAEFGIVGVDEFDQFHEIIGAMDDEYLSLVDRANAPEEPAAHHVSVTDTEGMKRLFGRLEQRKGVAPIKRKRVEG